MAAVDKQNAEALAKAQQAFAEAANAGMQPALECCGFPNHGHLAEYSVALNPNPLTGLLHEDIEAAFEIAETTSGRLWLGQPDHKLSIVWPLPKQADGPDGQKSPAQQGREKAHGTEAKS